MTKKTFGFYFSICSAVLALVAFVMYGGVTSPHAAVRPLLCISVILSIVVLALTLVKGKVPGGNLLPVCNAVLCMAAVALSISPMANTVVFAFMGMTPMETAQGYLAFVGVGLAAWCVSVIAAFPGIIKKTS